MAKEGKEKTRVARVGSFLVTRACLLGLEDPSNFDYFGVMFLTGRVNHRVPFDNGRDDVFDLFVAFGGDGGSYGPLHDYGPAYILTVPTKFLRYLEGHFVCLHANPFRDRLRWASSGVCPRYFRSTQLAAIPFHLLGDEAGDLEGSFFGLSVHVYHTDDLEEDGYDVAWLEVVLLTGSKGLFQFVVDRSDPGLLEAEVTQGGTGQLEESLSWALKIDFTVAVNPYNSHLFFTP